MASAVGETGIIIAIPQAQPLVARSHQSPDSGAALGVPAHITLLFPFVSLPDLTRGDLADLAAICAAEPGFEVTFRQVRQWPRVLWLAPEPDEPFRRLTLAIAARWPAFPPYGGKHAQITPHLSLLESADCVPFDELERDAAAQLPLQAPAREAQLIAFDGDRYHVVHRLSLG